MKKTLVVLGLALLMLIPFSMADPSAPTSLTEGSSSRRNLSSLADQSVEAQAGNVTQVDLSAIGVTQSWQGYYGNITGTIVLQNGQNQTFYNWSASTVQGEVYATRNASTNFASINCSTGGERTAEETALGQAASDSDSVSNTFSGTTHPPFSVGSGGITENTCFSTNAFDNTGSQSTSWFQILLSDDNSNMVYTTLINDSTTGFDGNSYDFQLLVGEDGHGNSAATTYYFYVELN